MNYKSNTINGSFLSLIILLLVSVNFAKGSSVPRPDHVVICILENHSYSQIIGSSAAPYINSLLPVAANMQEFYALTHPSQPNYIMLFSGNNQGETSDNLPAGTPWTTPNLGASILMTGYTFAAYSEDLPTTGSTVASSGAYARKHCPWVNWQGNGPNQIPASCNLSMDQFPTNYAHLPDLSFVIPNQNNDMHNGSDPGRITTGDSWVENFMKPYIDWAQLNNSLFILVFDEDNFTSTNRIVCLFVGAQVEPGDYAVNGYNHYDLLRTLEEMFTLPHSGNSINATPITEIWRTSTSISETNVRYALNTVVYPNPVNSDSKIEIDNETASSPEKVSLFIYDITGRIKNETDLLLMPGRNVFAFRREGLPSGVYTYRVKNNMRILSAGKVIVE